VQLQQALDNDAAPRIHLNNAAVPKPHLLVGWYDDGP
jgi:hypothetical protein